MSSVQSFSLDAYGQFTVFDKFLNRVQIRVMTHHEYLLLMSGGVLLKSMKKNTGVTADILVYGEKLWRMQLVPYGSKEWR